MKLGLLKRIPKEQLAKSGEVPPWLDGLLDPLNEFIEKVGLALQSRLTFGDNFLCKVVTQKFTSAVAGEVNPRASGQENLRVAGVLALDVSGEEITKLKWARKTNGNIDVTLTFTSGGEATCRILILLE